MAITPEDLTKPAPPAAANTNKPTLAQMETGSDIKQRLAAYIKVTGAPGKPVNNVDMVQLVGDVIAIHKFAGVPRGKFVRFIEQLWDQVQTQNVRLQ